MLTLLVVLATSAAPAEFTLAAPGLTYVGVSPQQGDVYLDYFAQQVSKRGVHVITRGDVEAQLGLERQKQLLGCGENSCTAELVGALGVSALVVGSLATVGTGFVVNIKVVTASANRTLAVYSERVANEERLYNYLERSAEDLAALLVKPKTLALRSVAWAPLAVGVLGGVGSGILFGAAKGLENEVATGDARIATLDGARVQLRNAVGLQTAAFVVGGVSLAALLTGAAFALFGAPSEGAPQVSFFLDPRGGGLALSWGLP